MKPEKFEAIKERNERRREIKAEASPGPWVAGAVYMSAAVHEGEASFTGDRWIYEGDCYLCAESSGIEKLIIRQYVGGNATYHVHLVKEDVFDEAELPPTVASASGFHPIAGKEEVYEFYQWPGKDEDGLATGIADAVFIAHARNDDVEMDIDDLIWEVESLQTQVETLRTQVERLEGHKQGGEEPDIPF
jgi:hypothetical protein